MAPRFYIPQLDGLRFCAFLGVFISHVTYAIAELPTGRVRWYQAEWWGQSALLAGALGVVLFFALSSYLITSLLVREWDTTGRIDVPAFWMRRILRIWPLYFGFLLVYVAIGGLTVPVFAAFSIFAGNWAEVVWRVDAGLAHPLWSVSVEEQFYLTWPLLLAALPRRFLRHTATGLVVTGVAVRYALFANGASIASVWLNTFSHLDAIGIGALIALGPQIHLAPAVRAALGGASAFALVACAGVAWFEFVQSPAIYLRAGAATLTLLGVAVACGGLLLGLAGRLHVVVASRNRVPGPHLVRALRVPLDGRMAGRRLVVGISTTGGVRLDRGVRRRLLSLLRAPVPTDEDALHLRPVRVTSGIVRARAGSTSRSVARDCRWHS